MGHFVKKVAIHVEHEEFPGEYVAIKPKLSLADRNRIQGAMAALNEQKKVDVDMGKYLNTILDTAITGWQLYERDDDDEIIYLDEDKLKPQLVKFDRKLIEQFDADDPLVDAVLTKIAELNPTLTGNTTED